MADADPERSSDPPFAPPQERQRAIDAYLQRRKRGDLSAMRELWELIYAEVHQMAHQRLTQEGDRRPFNTTVLVHELYLKAPDVPFENRAHLFGSLVRMMGQVIVDAARRAKLERKAGTANTGHLLVLDLVRLDFQEESTPELSARIVEALDALERELPRPVSAVWLRLVGGLTNEQVALCLGVSRRTVVDDLALARALLKQRLASAA